METKKRISIGLPLEIEWEAASSLVYVRTNFEIIGSEDGTPVYSYDETIYPAREFMNSHLTKLRADLDYLSMMAEVDL